MSKTEIVVYQEANGKVPLLEWMDSIPQKAQDKCIVKIERLAEMGHELRRPEADYLKDGIYELRASHMGIHHRILYFFHDSVCVLSQGVTKERAVPDKEIKLAVDRKTRYGSDPKMHTYEE